MERYRSVIDFVLFNVCWVANALSGLYDFTVLGPAVVLTSVVIHLVITDGRWTEVIFLLVVSTTGYLLDALYFRLGVIGFPTIAGTGVVPVWLFAQWLAFGLLFRHTIRWLRQRYILAGVLGATGGPLSYFSATKMNVLSLGHPAWQSLTIMAAGWALVVPIFGYLSQRYEHMNLGQS